MEDLMQNLIELSQIPGPVGRETLVQNYMEEHLRKYLSDIVYDRVGNLLAHFEGKGTKTVIAAHACEIGFVTKEITDDGLIKVAPNYKTRSVDTRILPFHDVTILTDTYERIKGVLTIETGHVIEAEKREKVPSLEDVSVDIGVSSREEAVSSGIDVGCPIVWDVLPEILNTRIKGKAMDDRLGLALLLELAESLSSSRDIYLASTVQEEVGVRGARALASQYRFDEAYILEITPTLRSGTLQLGKGPAIIYKDSSMHYHHQLIMECRRTAQENGIPLQPAVLERGITDGLGFFCNSATRTVLLGVPTLYPHSPGETIDMRDLQKLAHLLKCVLQ